MNSTAKQRIALRKIAAVFCEAEAARKHLLTHSPVRELSEENLTAQGCGVLLAIRHALADGPETYRSVDPTAEYTFPDSDPTDTERRFLEGYERLQADYEQAKKKLSDRKALGESVDSEWNALLDSFNEKLDELEKALPQSLGFPELTAGGKEVWEDWLHAYPRLATEAVIQRGRHYLQSHMRAIDDPQTESQKTAIPSPPTPRQESPPTWIEDEHIPVSSGMPQSARVLVNFLLKEPNQQATIAECEQEVYGRSNEDEAEDEKIGEFSLPSLRSKANKCFEKHGLQTRVTISSKKDQVYLRAVENKKIAN